MNDISFLEKRTEPATIKKINMFSDGNIESYPYIDISRMWVYFERDGRMNIFSQVGKARQNAFFYCRKGNNISPSELIFYNSRNYLVTDCHPIDNNYLKVSSVQIDPIECQHTARIYERDEYNRPVQKNGIRLVYYAFFTEKYLKNNESEASAILTDAYIAVTDKKIVLKEGDIIEIKENDFGIASGKYIVELAHKTSSFQNEYEIHRSSDI